MTPSSSFPGEPYVAFQLPDHPSERWWISVQCLLASMVFFLVVPMLLSKASSSKTSTVTKVSSNIKAILLGLAVLVFLILRSSNNRNARTIWEAPLLTAEECRTVLEMAQEVARENLGRKEEGQDDDEALLRDPVGWRKDRHRSYPTTDLNLVTDPFTKEHRDVLERLLNLRLAPLLARIFGIPIKALRANDMFVVRYDGDNGQGSLNRHTDSSHISFNILLNTEFEGGGTRFHNRLDDSFIDVHPSSAGQVILHNAVISHEGLKTTNGTRFILVGFTSVDTIDLQTYQSHQLSLFSSWLSLPWLQGRVSDASKTLTQNESSMSYFSKKAVALFQRLNRHFTVLGDIWAQHRHISLVREEHRVAYLQALDDSLKDNDRAASWFSGQQMLVSLDGTAGGMWKSRAKNEDKFRDL